MKPHRHVVIDVRPEDLWVDVHVGGSGLLAKPSGISQDRSMIVLGSPSR